MGSWGKEVTKKSSWLRLNYYYQVNIKTKCWKCYVEELNFNLKIKVSTLGIIQFTTNKKKSSRGMLSYKTVYV